MDIGFGVESGSYKGFYKMTIKNQSTPVFQKLEKNEEGKWVSSGEANSIAGYLQDVKIESYEYKNDEVKQLVLILDLGDGGPSKLEMNFNGISKGIINNLSNEKSFIGSKLSLRLYTKNDNPNCYCTLDDNKMSWGVPVDQVKANWKNDDFWVKVFEQKIKPNITLPMSNSNLGFGTTEKEVELVQENDDLPF